MSEWNENETLSVVEKISKRAAEDTDLHAKALSKPNEVIKEIAGKDVPAGKTIKFVALKDADFEFVLSDPQKDGELSDADLEAVASGRDNMSNYSFPLHPTWPGSAT